MSANPPPVIKTLQCEWVPPRTPSPKLLVVLHGRGDSAEGFRWMPEEFGFRDLGYLLVNAPDEDFGGRSWYALPPDQEVGVVRSRNATAPATPNRG